MNHHEDKLINTLQKEYGSSPNLELVFLDKVAEILDFEENHLYLDSLALSEDFTNIIINNFNFNGVKSIFIVLEYMRVSSRAYKSLLSTLEIIKQKFGDDGKIILTGSLINVLTKEQRRNLVKLKGVDKILPIDPIKGWDIENLFPEVRDHKFSISNPQELPLPSQLLVIPDYSLMKCEEYINFRAGTRIFPFRTSIGCKFRCVYCIDTIVWEQYKECPIENLEHFISKFVEKFNPDIIRFLDLLLNVKPTRLKAVTEVIRKIREKKLMKNDFFWVGMATADIPLSNQLTTQLYDSGCRYLWLGLESGSSRIRKLMQKEISPNMSLTLKNLKKAGINTLIYLIANFPGTKKEDTERTINFLDRNVENIDNILLSEFRLYRNSFMGKNPKKFDIRIDKKPKTSDEIRTAFSTLFTNLQYPGLKDYEQLIEKWQKIRKIDVKLKKIFTIEGFPILTEI